MRSVLCRNLSLLVAIAASVPAFTLPTHRKPEARPRPWMNTALSPDARAEMVLRQMTLQEKIDLLHGQGMKILSSGGPNPNACLNNGGAGFVLGVPRLGIPSIQMSDAAYGVRGSAENGRYSTALPSNLASAASWDISAACAYGALIGRELRAQGYNMSLGGGVDLARELRDGRTFEYMGEDPILAGTMVGNRIKCEQAQHVMGDIKHYAMNDQETGRTEMNAIIDDRAMRESDLLAFQLGISIGHPAAVMCAYNAVNGEYSCQNKFLLTTVLRRDWKFPGFVVSDWGATHSTAQSSQAGLDNEQPLDLFYGAKLKKAVESGAVPISQLNDHARRILRSEFASGIVDYPQQKSVVPVMRDLAIARRIEEQSIVLLKNKNNVLPLDAKKIQSIAVIGPHADTGMISGGGSAQVDPPGGAPTKWQAQVWFPTSPLKAIETKAPRTVIKFDSGVDPSSAAALARRSDIVIVFAYQWESEGMDLSNLLLPDNQNTLIDAVAAANPRTIVVLETGTAVRIPWLDKVSGVVEAWYAGSDGANAVANVLFGDANPSGKLPITFPRNEADMPHAEIAGPPAGSHEELGNGQAKPTFDVNYTDGLKVGYKWYDTEHKPVLFPFGFGLSYTTYQYSDLIVQPGNTVTVTFMVRNTGARAGAEIAEVYAALPSAADEPPKRLVGWSKVQLNPGESKRVSVAIPRLYLSIYDVQRHGWKLLPGQYEIMIGGSSATLPLAKTLSMK